MTRVHESWCVLHSKTLIDRCWPILLKKSKIERLQKSREGRLFGLSAAARLFKTITGIRGCVCANRFGPSRRRAWNASAVLKNLVRRPKRTFSTLSTQLGHSASKMRWHRREAQWPLRWSAFSHQALQSTAARATQQFCPRGSEFRRSQ